MVEHAPEERSVDGSIPSLGTSLRFYKLRLARPSKPKLIVLIVFYMKKNLSLSIMFFLATSIFIHASEETNLTSAEKQDLARQIELESLIHIILFPNHYNDATDEIKAKLEKNSDLVSFTDFFSYSPLDYAIMVRNYHLANSLFKHGKSYLYPFNRNTVVDLLKLSHEGKTSKPYNQKRKDRLLYIATTHGELSIAELLCDLGANPSSRPFNNKTPIEIAQRYGHLGIVETLSDSLTSQKNSDN